MEKTPGKISALKKYTKYPEFFENKTKVNQPVKKDESGLRLNSTKDHKLIRKIKSNRDTFLRKLGRKYPSEFLTHKIKFYKRNTSWAHRGFRSSSMHGLAPKKDLQIETEEETKEVSADLKALGFSKSMIGKPKSFTKHTSRCAKLTKWIEITVYELYLILEQEQKHHKQIDEEEICPICRCELYDDIMTMKKEEICVQQAEMLKDPTEISVIKFGNCSDHYFHKDCAEMMMGEKNHLKCPICSNIYGVLMGEMPPGVMSWQYYDAGYNS